MSTIKSIYGISNKRGRLFTCFSHNHLKMFCSGRLQGYFKCKKCPNFTDFPLLIKRTCRDVNGEVTYQFLSWIINSWNATPIHSRTTHNSEEGPGLLCNFWQRHSVSTLLIHPDSNGIAKRCLYLQPNTNRFPRMVTIHCHSNRNFRVLLIL